MSAPGTGGGKQAAVRQVFLAVAFVVVFAASTGLSVALGGRGAAAVGGIVGVTLVVSAFSGTLRGDLRRFAVVAPAILLAVVLPRIIGDSVGWLGGVALVLVILTASLLPGLGPRYSAFGLTFGLGAIFGYAYPLPAGTTTGQLAISVVAAVAVALLIRLVAGFRDPQAPLRVVLAELFVSPSLAADQTAVQLLQSDRPRTWMSDVAMAGFRYQAALAIDALRHDGPPSDRARALTSVAAEVAEVVRSAQPARHTRPPPDPVDDSVAAQALQAAWSAAAGVARGDDPPDPPRGSTPWRSRNLVRAGPPQAGDRHVLRLLGAVRISDLLSWSDPRFRHAVRTALAIGSALVISLVRPGDPLLVTLLGMTYGIAQPEWRQTRTKLVRRIVGVGVGGGLLILLTALAPERAWAPVGLTALVVGIAFIERVPAVFYAMSAVLTVSTAAARPTASPGGLILEYAVVTVVACLLAVVWGGLVPWPRRRPAAERIARARLSLSELLDQSARLIEQDLPFDAPWSRALRRSLAAQQDLVDVDVSTGRAAAPALAAGTALRALDAALAVALTAPGPRDAGPLRRARERLGRKPAADPAPAGPTSAPGSTDAAVGLLLRAEHDARDSESLTRRAHLPPAPEPEETAP